MPRFVLQSDGETQQIFDGKCTKTVVCQLANAEAISPANIHVFISSRQQELVDANPFQDAGANWMLDNGFDIQEFLGGNTAIIVIPFCRVPLWARALGNSAPGNINPNLPADLRVIAM